MNEPIRQQMEGIGKQISDAGAVALFLDFDGTLAPIVDRPELAMPSDQVRDALAHLTEKRDFLIGVISGRQLSDVKQRMAIDNIAYAGNHGLEIEAVGQVHLDQTAVDSKPELELIRETLKKRIAEIDGAFIEDKGLSLSVHCRLVASEQVERVRQSVHEELSRASHPFQLVQGNMVFEIRPRSHWTKADAVRWILQRRELADPVVIIIGDDVTDEDAFQAFPDQITVRVGSSDTTAARFYVDDTAEVLSLLKWLERTA